MVDLRAVVEQDDAFPRTVFVHMGSEQRAESFFTEYWPEAFAIGDPKQKLYRAFGISIGSVTQFVKPSVWKAFLSARSHGVGMPNGNTMRNPGAFLVRDGCILLAQEFEHFGVQVDVDAVKMSVATG